MPSFRSDKERILQLIRSLERFASARGREDVLPLATIREELVAAKMLVVVCGEFKRGKSSLINAFLEEPDLMPVAVDVTTSVVSSITYGERERIRVVLEAEPGGEARIVEIDRSQIREYVTEQGNPGNVRRVSMLLVELPNERLRDGLTLVDTPGVGGVNVRHTAVTYSFMPKADAVLFVGDALAPFATPELEFVKGLRRSPDTLITVVTKTDKVEDHEAVLQSNVEKLAAVLGCQEQEIIAIPVSSQAKLDWMERNDPLYKQVSNFDALDAALARMLREHREPIVIARAIAGLVGVLTSLRDPFQATADALASRTSEERHALMERQEKLRKRHQSLLHRKSRWRSHLRSEIKRIANDLDADFKAGFGNIEDDAWRRAAEPAFLKNPNEIFKLVEVEMDGLVVEISGRLSSEAAELHEELVRMTRLRLRPAPPSALRLERANVGRPLAGAARTDWWNKTVASARRASIEGTAGSAVGSVIGGLAGAAIGALFGGVGAGPGAIIGAKIGALFGGIGSFTSGAVKEVRRIQHTDQTLTYRQVKRVLRPYLRRIGRGCATGVKNTVFSLGRSMEQELTARIEARVRLYEGALETLEATRKLTEEELAREEKKVNGELETLDQVLFEADRIAEEWMGGRSRDEGEDEDSAGREAA
jgi:ribosome biogenesis GTPase A